VSAESLDIVVKSPMLVVTEAVAPRSNLLRALSSAPAETSDEGSEDAGPVCPPDLSGYDSLPLDAEAPCASRPSARKMLANCAISDTAFVSRVCNATAAADGSGPGTNIPPMAAGPVAGLSAVLPAASPAAEMPGLALDIITLLTETRVVRIDRVDVPARSTVAGPRPNRALPLAHHLHPL
jgi:hypothetical protein